MEPEPIFQNEKFEIAVNDILNDLDQHSCQDSKLKFAKNYLPIYQTLISRKMSGYFFPDIEREKLSLISLSINQIIDFIEQVPISKTSNVRQTLTPYRIFKYQQKIKGTTQLQQFIEFRENINKYSWSILFFVSSSWIFVNIFKNVYKKYAKEIVESCIDFLKRAGILEDVQWIKEELGMTPVDKGYRGIRHHGKKFKNIIGLDRKHIILQVSEMVWFLKTKKLVKLNFFDPIVQTLLLLSRSHILSETKMHHFLSQIPKKEYSAKAETMLPYVQESEPLRPRPPYSFEIGTYGSSSPPPKPQKKEKQKPLKSLISLNPNYDYLKPKGFLFIGPPGTGKTLLVQAIAGETGVPVVTQSGGLLQNPHPRLRGKGPITLHKLFLRAREIAPCIIFIDEVDGIGARRQFLSLYIDIHGRYDPIEFLENIENESLRNALPPQNFHPKIQRKAEFFDDNDPYWEEPEFTQTIQSTRIPIDVLQEMQVSRRARREQLSILTQLLIELDGLHSLDNVLVIGATNRFEILDPALMRPGRFQRILKFNLPDYAARINLLKLYTQASKIGIDDISWDYFSKRTYGLSSADIASIVFASELTAVQQSKKHTFETLERGIDLITSFPSDPVMFRLKNIFLFLETAIQKFFYRNTFFQSNCLIELYETEDLTFIEIAPKLQETSNLLRNCYYNIGKMLILFCLQIMPFFNNKISLWERPKNFRFFFFTKNFNEFDEFDQKMLSRNEIEKRFLTFFGGKAAESLFIFLPIHKFSSEIYFDFDQTFLSIANSLEQSNFGIENEIQTAQSLLNLMVEKWYFYFERIATEKFHPIFENSNLWEYSEKEIFLAQALVDEMIIDLDMRNRLSKNEQKHSYQAWWMKKVATRLNFRFREKSFLQWSRIYLSDPEYSAQNIEWVAPDEYFHTLLRTPPYCMAWTHFLENGRFAISNLLLLRSFNTVFKTLRPFSEFMDFISDSFLRYESLNEMEFKSKIYQFFYSYLNNIK